MTFVEALETGKPMRRKSWWQGRGGDRGLVLDSEGAWTWAGGREAAPPLRSDYLSDDWEVLP